ncbi:DUF3667 domain-containing protein [Carboxylicivirga linearis]|uniref:DUF3667 domain-containing protein n=1 Tax=Carboxylicivirga linearis TaxID=1628157 RepID=A0ABS5JYM6_9BACT|nr:DUF3667 domain-containing protein [Carboxylicivirga linearis]MBS2099511.1 DUF3667 domain-containing protein [Carboxylicivirga linearis]
MSKDNHTSNPEINKEEIVCKNCDTSFSGQYCPNCGQHVKEIERPIRFMIVDFMGTFVSFDTRLVKTLVAILFKPGKLTQDFLDGKRARYMPPFRFYVFASFVMFLLISTITGNSIKESMQDSSNSVVNLNGNIIANDSVQILKDSIQTLVDNNLKESLDSASYQKYKKVADQRDTINVITNGIIKDIITDDEDDSKYEKTAKLIQEHPELYTGKLFQFTSWALFLFMPIFAFFLWILFYRSKSLYIGHLIFALNIHSFIFTITAIVAGMALLFPNHSTAWTGYLYLLTPIYQVVGARKLYHRKWINTFFKLTLVWFLYGFVLLVGLITLFVITFFVM